MRGPSETTASAPVTRWERIEELFLNARELDAYTRKTFLDNACGGDAEFRADVEKRLDDYSAAIKFFQRLHDGVDVSNGRPMFSPGELVAARFQIVRLVGRGGMGEVYEAEDVHLDHKPVALKTLRASMVADNRALAGVKNELDVARQVTHPNVCRVHDIYEHRTTEGAVVCFFSMELLRGETLAHRLRGEGRMTPVDALPIVRQMVAGLQAAHSAGVIHGDFKPANVVIARSDAGVERIVVTDFGLARLVPAGGAVVPGTHEWVGWGTPGYMAPEQLQGRGVTCASDIYALGVVLYEMITGERPFRASVPDALTLTKLRQSLRPPKDHVSKLDPRWNTAILRCLEPDPERRFNAASEVIPALEGRRPITRWWPAVALTALAATVLLTIPSVRHATWEKLWSVSPALASIFSSQQTVGLLPSIESNDPNRTTETDALTLGLTAAVTDQLAALWRDEHRFLVIPAVEIIGTGLKTPAQAEGTLSVNHIGTLRVAHVEGGGGAVTLKRYAGSPDALTVRETQSNQIAIRSESLLAAEVLKSLTQMFGLSVSSAAWQRLAFGSTPRAERSNLLGRGYVLQHLLAEATSSFEEAIRQDPKFVDAYVGLSDVYLRQYADTADNKFVTRAFEAVDTAIALAPTDARAHVIKGRAFRTLGLDQRAIDEEFLPVLRRDPNNADARNLLARAYEAVGNLQQAEEAYAEAISRHPHYWLGYENLGAFQFRHGFNRDAQKNFENGARYAPSNLRAISNLGGIYLAQGMLTAAEAELSKGLKLQPDAVLYNNLGWVYISDGRFDEARKYLTIAVSLAGADSVIRSSLARVYRWSHMDQDAKKAYASALARAEQEMRDNPTFPEIRANYAYLLAENGRGSEALDEIRRTLDAKPKDTTVLFVSALVYERLGRRAEALETLARAVSNGYSIAKIEHHPDLKILQGDRGYQKIRMALESRPRR